MSLESQRREFQQMLETVRAACRRVEHAALMEVCGTHTVALFRSGVRSVMPANLRLISGPGCPVCVTTQGYLDAACDAARQDNVTVCTYGDMVRVPGRNGSLETLRGQGADVQVVYSARDAVKFAASHPERQVVFLAVGFETTAPSSAAAVVEAEEQGLDNFSILTGHKLVMPVLAAMLSAGDVPIDGLLCPGHVSVITGSDPYRDLAERFNVPCVIAGFEPAQLLDGIGRAVELIAERRGEMANVYGVAVRPDGNRVALELTGRVFQPADVEWRAMGAIPRSGLALREAYRRFDAAERFGLTIGPDYEPSGCLCGQVIQGKADPADCPMFGNRCTPNAPIGPCMVSSEGACAAWHKYGRP